MNSARVPVLKFQAKMVAAISTQLKPVFRLCCGSSLRTCVVGVFIIWIQVILYRKITAAPQGPRFVAMLKGMEQGNPPTWYEYYEGSGIQSGLVPTDKGFFLNGKPIWIMSGSLHYFRVHPDYWRDRLLKLRAAGLNAVETYVPWNLHNPEPGKFDFGAGGNDMSPFLDIVKFLQAAREMDLFVIFRPGPFICAEWEFGGLPSWLLRDRNMQVRRSYQPYLDYVRAFFEKVDGLVKTYQFDQYGGPIIAVQVENEYGAFGYDDAPRDKAYLQWIMDLHKELGITSMFFTSDSPTATKDWGAIPGALQTANFQSNAYKELSALQTIQPNMPLMVTEYWTGWFDHWTESHHTTSPDDFTAVLTDILNQNSSVNFYMFHGGTSFGFMNGANNANSDINSYQPDVNSYDYDAPLTEWGDYHVKYHTLKKILATYQPVVTNTPDLPAPPVTTSYGTVSLTEALSYLDLINQVPSEFREVSATVKAMEDLDINNGSGQSYGFVVYRTTQNLNPDNYLLVRGHIRDLAVVLVNGQRLTSRVCSSADLDLFGSWRKRDSIFNFTGLPEPQSGAVLDIMVENLGRNNYGKPHNFIQRKGLWEGPVLLGSPVTRKTLVGSELSDWEIIALELKGPFVRNLQNWEPLPTELRGPIMVKGTFNVEGTPVDTFLLMEGWGKGVVFLNGFNLGRYWCTGPTKTLYIPAPLLKTGQNTIVIFELYQAKAEVTFVDAAQLG